MEDFFRGWEDYKNGFGGLDSQGEFWLGLEKIYRLTSSKRFATSISLPFLLSNPLNYEITGENV